VPFAGTHPLTLTAASQNPLEFVMARGVLMVGRRTFWRTLRGEFSELRRQP
jgi:hypothetical protein